MTIFALPFLSLISLTQTLPTGNNWPPHPLVLSPRIARPAAFSSATKDIKHQPLAILATAGRPDCTMTLGGQPDDLLDLATQPAASQQQAQQQQQHRKRQRRGGGPPLQVEGACIVDLASQSSCELQGSPPAAFGGSKDRPAVDGRTVRLVLLCTRLHAACMDSMRLDLPWPSYWRCMLRTTHGKGLLTLPAGCSSSVLRREAAPLPHGQQQRLQQQLVTTTTRSVCGASWQQQTATSCSWSRPAHATTNARVAHATPPQQMQQQQWRWAQLLLKFWTTNCRMQQPS